MFMSSRVNWINTLDPYYVQRVVLHKAIFIAVLLVYAYWLFRPEDFSAYISSIFAASVYELPGPSLRERNHHLLFAFACMFITGISFFLLTPYQIVFVFYGLVFIRIIFFITKKYFPILKSSIMLIILSGSLNIAAERVANWQTLITLISSMLLSATIVFLALQLFTGNYFKIWSRATVLYLETLIDDLKFMPSVDKFAAEVMHINMMQNYCKCLSAKEYRHAVKISDNIRNIQFAHRNYLRGQKNKTAQLFWQHVEKQLQHLAHTIETNHRYSLKEDSFSPKTPTQKLVIQYLEKTIHHWNALWTLKFT